MSDETKVYKVRHKKTGMYRKAGGGFSKTGKTWNNLAHLKNSIATEGWYHWSGKINELPDPEIEIVEFVVRHDEGNTRSMRDLVIAERRKRDLAKKHGESFATLVERIEEAGQNNDFQWVLTVQSLWSNQGDLNDMLALIKELKLKQNKDYKKASSFNSGGAFAFASKDLAMRVRLNFKGKVQSVDIKNYVETDLDDAQDPVV